MFVIATQAINIPIVVLCMLIKHIGKALGAIGVGALVNPVMGGVYRKTDTHNKHDRRVSQAVLWNKAA